MSYFMAYFETNNKQSQNYTGFSDIGRYVFPKKIYGGSIIVCLKGKEHKASIITDFSKQSANDYFLKKGMSTRDYLIKFIAERSRNESIISNIIEYIDTGQKTISPKGSKIITIGDLSSFFVAGPRPGICIEVA